ncbi:SDR family oxidoreductase [Desulfovibrio legallii]|uniref:NAD(P)-dependent dehydrogenase, short-chain alcohol dehydrogenase family n=1 Tax=Desulfovibrio legallii TaxID=571438 RepID=A0A1G7J7Y9_9BACT|nr:SDR family oxidoreductase [Desulfovibrio legallii]SDF20904.1 NAD(P)-dependent dehydrogenase, short-chain alcohol dehydrogenase family [Desulfovibrio legallii]
MDVSLEGRVALVTGATGHIGQAICLELAAHGAAVAVLDLQEQTCVRLCEAIAAKYSVPVLPVPCNLAEDAQVHAVPHRIAAALGGLDILINNAGFVGTSGLPGWVTDIERQTTETWRKALEVNLTAPFTLCRESIPYLKKSGRGSIINVASIYGVLGPDMSLYDGTNMGNPIAYATSKGGLIQMTHWFATVLAPDIRANSICPGGIWRNQPEAFTERYKKRTPMKRMATEEDMVGTVLYLASDLSRYVTGQNIMVDGGWSSW